MKNPEQLIADYLDNALSESDQTNLNAWLKADLANMQRFTEAVMFEQQIREAAQAKAQQQAVSGIHSKIIPAKQHWLSWLPITAAAAGIMFGTLCTSMVFALAIPQFGLDRLMLVPFFNDGFEAPESDLRVGFPSDAGAWSGDAEELVSRADGIHPAEGLHMLRLAPRTDRKFSSLTRIFDLAELPTQSLGESTTIEVTASFHGSGLGWLDQNQIRLAAFAEAPKDVRKIWNADARLEAALLQTARTVTTNHCDHGWQTLKVDMKIPAGTRSLVVFLGSGMADDQAAKTAHFVDDVQIHTITQPSYPMQAMRGR